jgi:flavin reductase (DIM6/NTAB) family NADH-FMN oxidoreductase RutF
MALSKVYGWLEAGPVVLLATAERGKANVMTMSWHTMLDFDPPLLACVVGEGDHSFRALRRTGECVIAIPGAAWPSAWSASATVPGARWTSSPGSA